jgi:hypothetical protein
MTMQVLKTAIDSANMAFSKSETSNANTAKRANGAIFFLVFA